MKSFLPAALRLASAALILVMTLGAINLISSVNTRSPVYAVPHSDMTAEPGSACAEAELDDPDNDNYNTSPDLRQSVTIVMVGDLLMHRFVQLSGQRKDGSYNYDHIFANVFDIISDADIAIINQETLLAGERFGLSGYPLFNAPCEVADSIARAGFDVVLQATNHSLDRGAEGLFSCIDYWRGNHPSIKLAGCAKSAEDAAQICVAERGGIRVAILNYTYGTNGIPLPDGMSWIVKLLDEDRVRADIAAARETADFVVVCPHWGVEYTHTPSDEQKRWCGIFLDAGADLVIGTHPHVIQPVEWYERGEGGRMLVYYSLGNFINSTAEQGRGVCDRMLGGMARITLVRGDDGTVGIGEASVVPLVTQLDNGYAGVTAYLFSDYSEELAALNRLLRERDSIFSYKYCGEVFKSVFGEFWTEGCLTE